MHKLNHNTIVYTKRLGLEDSRGMLRVGPRHYNTVETLGRIPASKTE
jgi:hypothetical protein